MSEVNETSFWMETPVLLAIFFVFLITSGAFVLGTVVAGVFNQGNRVTDCKKYTGGSNLESSKMVWTLELCESVNP